MKTDRVVSDELQKAIGVRRLFGDWSQGVTTSNGYSINVPMPFTECATVPDWLVEGALITSALDDLIIAGLPRTRSMLNVVEVSSWMVLVQAPRYAIETTCAAAYWQPLTRGRALYECRCEFFPMQFEERTAGERPRRTWAELSADEREGWETTALLYDGALAVGVTADAGGQVLYGCRHSVSPNQWREHVQAFCVPRQRWAALHDLHREGWAQVAAKYECVVNGREYKPQASSPVTSA